MIAKIEEEPAVCQRETEAVVGSCGGIQVTTKRSKLLRHPHGASQVNYEVGGAQFLVSGPLRTPKDGGPSQIYVCVGYTVW